MQKVIEVSGKNEDEAIATALKQLELTRDEVSIEIAERAKPGFLGIGAQRAVVRVSYEAPDEPVAAKSVDAKKSAPVKSTDTKKSAPVRSSEPKKGARSKFVEAKRPEKPDSDAPVSAESQEEVKERLEVFLEGLLSHMGLEAKLDISQREDGGFSAQLSGPNMGAVIGRRGETLDAIQHLANYSINRGAQARRHITIDAESYRSKREESLVRLAEKMAEKTLKYRRSMALEPMNSYERHVIHTALQNYEGVTTCSSGTEPNRRVVISCEKPK
ncbi:MAG: protein jag [Oscillospiraceae bacterium]|jgi:spoIIIJ-associated protein|nr:protein jag [Oscillospiraceae bacterium]